MDGIVQTVLGPVSPQTLGYTLTHEHLSMKFEHFHRSPPENIPSDYFTNNIERLNQIGFIRQYPYSSSDNLVLNDERSREAVLSDVMAYKNFGGGTIVENTTAGLNRDLNFIKSVSKKTNVNIVVGAGFYIGDMQPNTTLQFTEENLYNYMLEEMTVGCKDGSGVKAGVLGEIASVWPITDFERKVIRAAAAVQQELGCGVTFHPHRISEAPFEIIRIYLEAGGKADKAVMSHLDRSIQDKAQLLQFAELGTYCQWDLFGVEVSNYQLCEEIDMPSDAQRLEYIKYLVEEGRRDKILMSHDIHTKHRLSQFGGHGYHHILVNVLPKMKSRGFDEATIKTITVDNPARWLTIQKYS